MVVFLIFGIFLLFPLISSFKIKNLSIIYFIFLYNSFLFIVFALLNLWKKDSFVFLFNEYDKIGLDEYFPIERNWDVNASNFFHDAASAGHPQALLILGAMIYSGRKYTEDRALGKKYMEFAISEGAIEPKISISGFLGIDPDNIEKSTKVTPSDEAGKIILTARCEAKINDLFEAGRLTEKLRTDLLDLVKGIKRFDRLNIITRQNIEPLDLVNILKILNTDWELDDLTKNAPRNVGWDAEKTKFIV